MSESSNQMVKGKFEDLSMFQTIAIKKDYFEQFLQFFHLSPTEQRKINLLSNKGSQSNMLHKEIHHFLELFAMAYTLAMCPDRDMSGCIPCAWQMGYGN